MQRRSSLRGWNTFPIYIRLTTKSLWSSLKDTSSISSTTRETDISTSSQMMDKLCWDTTIRPSRRSSRISREDSSTPRLSTWMKLKENTPSCFWISLAQGSIMSICATLQARLLTFHWWYQECSLKRRTFMASGILTMDLWEMQGLSPTLDHGTLRMWIDWIAWDLACLLEIQLMLSEMSRKLWRLHQMISLGRLF